MTITVYNEAGEVVTDPHEQARRLGADAIYDEAGNLVWAAKSDKTPRPADELWGADPDCDHNIVDASGGGVKCTKCHGWCCY